MERTLISRAELKERWGRSDSLIASLEEAGRLHPRNNIARKTYLLAEVEALEQEGIDKSLTNAARLRRALAENQMLRAALEAEKGKVKLALSALSA